jgi:aminoglycoside/choline kinase family phosphotransferase
MSETIEIPTRPEEITTVWLTKVLRSAGFLGETAVVSLSVEPMNGAGVVGQMARLKPVFRPLSYHLPTSFIAKFSLADPERRMAMLNAYAREVAVYQKLVGQIKLTLPRCYYSDIHLETARSILLLADLGHLRQETIVQGCSLSDAELVVRHLAQHHATWWENPQLETFDYLGRIMTDFTEENIVWYQSIWDQFEDKITDVLPDSYLPQHFLYMGDRYAKQRPQIASKVLDAPMTIVHNDIHSDNLMFATEKADPPLTVVDWQTCGIGPGVADIVRFIITSLSVKQRRLAEQGLLQTYHAVLVEQGVRNYSLEQCWRDYRLSFFRNLALVVFVISFTDLTTPYMREILEITVPRLASFAEDHRVHEFLSVETDQ